MRLLVALFSLAFGASLAWAQQPTGAGPMTVDVWELDWLPGYSVKRSYWGRVEPRREAMAAFRMAGLVSDVHVDLGDSFVAGEVLAELDSVQAEAQLRVAEQNLELAKENLQRLKAVDAAGYGSAEGTDTAERTLQIRQAEVEQARDNLARHQVLAPWTGRVQQRLRDEGSVVGAATPMLHLIEDGALEVRVGIAPDLVASIERGQPQPLRLGEQVVQVRLTRLAPAPAAGSRTRQAVFALPEGVGHPGQGAELRLQLVFQRQGFWVPIRSLSQLRKGLWSLMVVNDEGGAGGEELGRIGQRIVEILHLDGARAYVDGALSAGDLVVVSGVSDLVAGQKVRHRLTKPDWLPASSNQANRLRQ